MKPVPTITTNIKIRSRYIFRAFIRTLKIRKKPRTLIPPSHKSWGLALLIIGSSIKLSATAGVVIVTHDAVLIAADSTIGITDSKGSLVKTIQGCKIMREGDIFYVAAGEYMGKTVGFDLFGITKAAIIKAGNVKNIYPAIERPILEHLPDIVEHAKVAYPEGYTRWMQGYPIISIVVASFEDNRPIAAFVEFSVDTKGRPLQPAEHTMTSIPGQIQVVGIGHDSETRRITTPDSWFAHFRADPITASREIIQSEIDLSIREKDSEVGPPISILLINKTSAGMVPGYEGKCQ